MIHFSGGSISSINSIPSLTFPNQSEETIFIPRSQRARDSRGPGGTAIWLNHVVIVRNDIDHPCPQYQKQLGLKLSRIGGVRWDLLPLTLFGQFDIKPIFAETDQYQLNT